MIDTNNMIGAAVGNEQVVALAIGKDIVWTASEPEPDPNAL